MERWTELQVVALAPDDRSVAAARKLARPGPWSDLGSTDALVWGKCQGSGSTPYQVSVDLTGPAATCTCPSRKFPCKHGLALLLLWVRGDGSVADADTAADFADDWASGRRERAGARAAKATGGDAAPDPVAQAKRLADRLALMDAGMDDFARWLEDLVRNGLATARHQPYGFWDETAARLVDAQLPGLAERVRRMGSAVAGRDDWADHLMEECGRWWCAAGAWRRRDVLDADDVGNLRAFIGWAHATDDVRKAEAITETWTVLGVHRTDDGRLQQQRTWLRGEGSGELVVVLDFAAVGGALGVAKVVGSRVRATVARYPGSGVRRALFVDEPDVVGSDGTFVGAGTIDDVLASQSSGLAANPWLERFPVCLSDVVVAVRDHRAIVVDGDGRALVVDDGSSPWPILARTGGRPTTLFGELEDGRIRPLSITIGDALVSV